MATLESAGCPVCQSPGLPRFEQGDLLLGLPGTFGQRYCPSCELYFLSPRVPESGIGAFYPPAYWPAMQDSHPGFIRSLAVYLGLARRRGRVIERFLPNGGRLLDAGCGNCSFLDALRGPRWTKYAMDVEWAGAAPCPFEFHGGRFDHDPPRLSNLDAVTLWHVFEHFYHPRKALENAAAILQPKGFLFVAIPDLDSIEPRLFGKYWIGWDPPRHIATWSRRALQALLEEAGFRLVEVVPDVYTGDWFMLNVDFWLQSKGIRRQLHRSLIPRALLSPFVFTLSRLGLAPSKIYVAQR